MDVCCAFYHRVNDDVFETFLKTFRKVSKALLQVYTDNVPIGLQVKWADKYFVEWILLRPEEVKDRRCLCKMECVQDCLSNLTEGDRLLVSDVDVYFLEDPFSAFVKCGFDVGVTLRLHFYQFPVNSGLFFIKMNKKTEEMFGCDFKNYVDNHPEKKNQWDWGIDQDYINFLFSVGKAKDVGWEYNFCPNTDVFGIKMAADMIRRAYESKSVKVLHLKSELKLCIYSGFLEDAVVTNVDGRWNWQKEGK